MLFLIPGYRSVIDPGGMAILLTTSIIGQKGGVIVNPLNAADQGLQIPESIFVNLLAAPLASLAIPGTSEIIPGQWFLVPPGANVWVNAASKGHKFTSFFSSSYQIQYPPTPV